MKRIDFTKFKDKITKTEKVFNLELIEVSKSSVAASFRPFSEQTFPNKLYSSL